MDVAKREGLVTSEQAAHDYPDYSFGERVADGAVHMAGIVSSIFAAGWLVGSGRIALDAPVHVAMAIYAVCAVTLFICSAFYHMTPVASLRPTLRRFDQSAIFFKIAGTYTPLVVIVGTALSFSVLGFIWVAALIGAAFKLFTGDALDRYTVALYLLLGWTSLLLIWPLYQALSGPAASLIVLGGLTYTVGVYFHQSKTIKYANAIWHGCVLAASAMHFSAIVSAVPA